MAMIEKMLLGRRCFLFSWAAIGYPPVDPPDEPRQTHAHTLTGQLALVTKADPVSEEDRRVIREWVDGYNF